MGGLGCLAGVQAERGKVEEVRQRWAQLVGGRGTNSRDEGARVEPRWLTLVQENTVASVLATESRIRQLCFHGQCRRGTATAASLPKTSWISTAVADSRSHEWQKPSQYCKLIILQLKYINFKNPGKITIFALRRLQN